MISRFRQSLLSVCVLFPMLIATCGCFQRRAAIETEYGKLRGKSGGTSVNGVSVFADMFRDRGQTVARYSRLSPKIERYETLIWFPGNQNCPSDDAIQRLEDWLNNGYQRTLIYVGYDCANEVDYFRQVAQSTDGEQKQRALRALAEAKMRQDTRLYGDPHDNWRVMFKSGQLNDDKCSWFDIDVETREQSNQIGGLFVESLQRDELPMIESQLWLAPREGYVDSHPGRELEVLLTVDSRPFAFRYRDELAEANDYWSTQNQLIILTNGNFLTNYGLVDSNNRHLAKQLIDQVNSNYPVLFLESDEGGIEVSDSDFEGHNTWSWITKKPLSYMVPHFLAWGVLFCFAFYPIFGRPRQAKNDRYRSFGDHIGAIARLSRRHVPLTSARAKVLRFLETDESKMHFRPHLTSNSAQKKNHDE